MRSYLGQFHSTHLEGLQIVMKTSFIVIVPVWVYRIQQLHGELEHHEIQGICSVGIWHCITSQKNEYLIHIAMKI
jgi:hypothetical protein